MRRRHLSGRAGRRDLTPRQYAVLLTVAQNEGLNQTQLVELTGIDRSTLADVVRRMLKKGLLQRRRTRDDARAYAVKLTDEGRKVLKAPIRWPAASTSDPRRPPGAAARSLPAGSQRRSCKALSTLEGGEDAAKGE